MRTSIPFFLLNSFWFSLLSLHKYDKMLNEYSLKSRWTSVPWLMISNNTSTSPLLLKLDLKKSNFEAYKIAFIEASLLS
jgi:hypothetical protein